MSSDESLKAEATQVLAEAGATGYFDEEEIKEVISKASSNSSSSSSGQRRGTTRQQPARGGSYGSYSSHSESYTPPHSGSDNSNTDRGYSAGSDVAPESRRTQERRQRSQREGAFNRIGREPTTFASGGATTGAAAASGHPSSSAAESGQLPASLFSTPQKKQIDSAMNTGGNSSSSGSGGPSSGEENAVINTPSRSGDSSVWEESTPRTSILRGGLDEDEEAYRGDSQPSRQRIQQLQRRISDLENELEDTKHQKHVQAVSYDKKLGELSSKLKVAQEKAKNKEETYKSKIKNLETRVKQADHNVKCAKEEFPSSNELLISDDTARDIKIRPEHQVSLKEHIQYLVHESVKPLKDQVKSLREELHAAKEAESEAKTDKEKNVSELLHRASIAETRQASAERQQDALRESNNRMQERLSEALSEIEVIKHKSNEYDSVNSRKEELEHLHENDVKQLEELKNQLSSASRERDHFQGQLEDARKELEMLKADKRHLSVKVEDVQDTLSKREKALEELERKKERAEQRAEKLAQQIQEVRQHVQNDIEKRASEQLEKVKSESDREIKYIRESTRELHQREVQHLEKAKSDALMEVERLQQKLDNTSSKYDQLKDDYDAACSTYENQMSDLRGQLKMKMFEYERCSASLEEQTASLKQLQRQYDVVAEQLQEAKDAYSELDAQTSKQLTSLESQLQMEREKVSAYEQLELDLDSAVLVQANVENSIQQPASDENKEDFSSSSQQVMETMGSGVPTKTRRRIRQSIDLARRLMQALRDNSRLKAELQRAQERVDSEREKYNDLASELETTGKPQKYMIEQMREKEQLLREARDENDRLYRRIQEIKAQLDDAESSREQAENDLKRVLDRRGDVESIVSLVQQALKSRGLSRRIQEGHRGHEDAPDENEEKQESKRVETETIEENDNVYESKQETATGLTPSTSRSDRAGTGYSSSNRVPKYASAAMSTGGNDENVHPYSQPSYTAHYGSNIGQTSEQHGSISYQHGNAAVYTHYVPIPFQSATPPTVFMPPTYSHGGDPSSSGTQGISGTVEPVENVTSYGYESEQQRRDYPKWHQRVRRPA
eukprot:gb/GECG01006051.1/.p1 GENE.gb/GECG01006051.1/~~gb/GECG01006051.1/.p1  ORF type:complete len:1077 (+),score=237.64 gb/GECG01006051.1/:1-3231(+)